MTDQKPKEKRVRIEKLQALSDELLKQRAEAAIAKIESKKQRYQQSHQLNMMRLSNYEKYKLADKSVCLKLLSERQQKKSLPLGNAPTRVLA